MKLSWFLERWVYNFVERGPLIRLNRAIDWNQVYPSDVEEEDVEDTEDGRGQPDGDEGDEGESDAPDESQRQGKDGSQQTVDPVAWAGEQNVRSAPDGIESVGGIRFSQNIFKVQLQRQMEYNSSWLASSIKEMPKHGCWLKYFWLRTISCVKNATNSSEK